ncbi:uncharacterized protein LOC144323505 [Canis aureus]
MDGRCHFVGASETLLMLPPQQADCRPRDPACSTAPRAGWVSWALAPLPEASSRRVPSQEARWTEGPRRGRPGNLPGGHPGGGSVPAPERESGPPGTRQGPAGEAGVPGALAGSTRGGGGSGRRVTGLCGGAATASCPRSARSSGAQPGHHGACPGTPPSWGRPRPSRVPTRRPWAGPAAPPAGRAASGPRLPPTLPRPEPRLQGLGGGSTESPQPQQSQGPWRGSHGMAVSARAPHLCTWAAHPVVPRAPPMPGAPHLGGKLLLGSGPPSCPRGPPVQPLLTQQAVPGPGTRTCLQGRRLQTEGQGQGQGADNQGAREDGAGGGQEPAPPHTPPPRRMVQRP